MNNNHKLKVFSGRANVPLAEKIAQCLGDPLGKITLGNFPDGETSVRIEEDVRGRDVFVVQPTCPPVNENLMELLIMLDAFKRASPARITAVLPVLRLRPPGPQGQGPRADHRQARRQPAHHGRGRPRARPRPARRPDPGLLRHPGRPPARRPGHQRLHPQPEHPAATTSSSSAPTRAASRRRCATRRSSAAQIAIVDKRRTSATETQAGQPDRRAAGGQGGGHLRRHDLDGRQRRRGGQRRQAATAPSEVYACATHGVLCGPAIEQLRERADQADRHHRQHPAAAREAAAEHQGARASPRCWPTPSSASTATSR